jgi:hypothetical protein
MSLVVFFLVATALWQWDANFRVIDLAVKGQVQEQQRLRQSSEEIRKHLFKQRFDRLAAAMRDFAETYNRDQGRVWPAKQAQELRKAMQELEELEEFQTRRGK